MASYARAAEAVNEEAPSSQLHPGMGGIPLKMESSAMDQHNLSTSDPAALYSSQYLQYGYSSGLPPPPPLLGNPQGSINNSWFTPSLVESAAAGYPQAMYESPRYDVPLPPGMGMRPSPFRVSSERPSSFLQSMPVPPRSTSFNPATSQDGHAAPYNYGYQYPPPPPPPPMGVQEQLNLNTSLNLQASHGGGRGGLVSPSGVTASSLQVHAPSSTHTNSSYGGPQLPPDDAGKANQGVPSAGGGNDDGEGVSSGKQPPPPKVLVSDEDISGERGAGTNGDFMSSDIPGENL